MTDNIIPQVTNILKQAWDFFAIPWPGTGMSFGTIFIGAFIVSLAIRFLFPILGIGAGLTRSVSRGAGRVASRARARSHSNSGREE